MILISSFIQVGVIVSSILGTELYVAGGWVLVGMGVACFNILPLLLLPLLGNINVEKSSEQKVVSSDEKELLEKELLEKELLEKELQSKFTPGPQPISNWTRRVAFYFPDVVLFLNNVVAEIIGYVLPVRIVYSSTYSLTSAVPLLRIFGIVSFISALTLSYLSSRFRNFNIIRTMMIGNVLYHSGAVVAFGATTSNFRFLNFSHQLLIGLVLMGLGEACHLNLCIPSKFALYDKWGLEKRGLGEEAAKLYNIVLNLASTVGTVMSALSLSDESEVPTVAGISGLGAFLFIGLLLSNLVK